MSGIRTHSHWILFWRSNWPAYQAMSLSYTVVVPLFKILSAQLRSNEDLKGLECSNYWWSSESYISVVTILFYQHCSQLNKVKGRKCKQHVYMLSNLDLLKNLSDRFQSELRALRHINLNIYIYIYIYIYISGFTFSLRVH